MNDTIKIIGIAGGMGPKAGAMLFDYILEHTNAQIDQEHLPVVHISFPEKINDRTAFLEGKVQENPAYEIIEVLKKLTLAGAQVIGIPCNTSHTPQIFNIISQEFGYFNNNVKLLNMPLEVSRYLQLNYKRQTKIGVLTTNGTYRSGVYESYLSNSGLTPIIPNYEFQNESVHKLIYDPEFGLKANTKNLTSKAITLFDAILTYFKERDVSVILLGCTELSMLKDHMIWDTNIVLVDSTEVLAKALIREATSPKKVAHKEEEVSL
ncbi:aspartate/glutamate racemase family protein [Aquimarina sediminis]|uniref:aspartate/glutamate racemase family protein n=1 Tax=Aquimarina sediminis TaxID=2070536 RepID=UPI000CA04BF8|nr:amino acid racemase [Aquimarina sediminis]